MTEVARLMTPMAENDGTVLTRFNALRHGILSRYTVLPWEDEGRRRAPEHHGHHKGEIGQEPGHQPAAVARRQSQMPAMIAMAQAALARLIASPSSSHAAKTATTAW